MPTYLIDMTMMATFRVTAEDEVIALQELMRITCDLQLDLHVGCQTPIEFVNVTCRDNDPEVVDVF